MRSLKCAVVLAVLLGCGAANGAGGTQFAITPRSKLFLNGSSNVAPWRCTGATLDGTITVASPLDRINDVIDHIEDGNIAKWMAHPEDGRFAQPRLDLIIPIASLRCTGGRPMETDMNRSLRAGQFPSIVFHFDGLGSEIRHDIDGQQFRTTITGKLSLAGVTREVAFPVTAKRVSRTRFHVTAEIPARMTEFGIKPPTAFFGMIKAANDLSVRFDLMLEAAP